MSKDYHTDTQFPARGKRYGQGWGIVDNNGELLVATVRPTTGEAISSVTGTLPNRSKRWKDYYARGYRCVRVWMTYWYPPTEFNPIDFPKKIREENARSADLSITARVKGVTLKSC